MRITTWQRRLLALSFGLGGDTRTATSTFTNPSWRQTPHGPEHGHQGGSLHGAAGSHQQQTRVDTVAWTDPTLTPGSTRVGLVHLTELRTALSQAYQAACRQRLVMLCKQRPGSVCLPAALHLPLAICNLLRKRLKTPAHLRGDYPETCRYNGFYKSFRGFEFRKV